ncbi:MAG: hypothetical protein QOJ02_1719 [Acidobacteriota bacterium]|jgi:hypothetical protein|nr:hypothetical protein [Acidobacteriota bacterium]
MPNGEAKPYLLSAVFCEKVLDEKDNILSAIRIIERLTVEFIQPVPPDPSPVMIETMILIKFATVGIEGEYNLHLKMRNPAGKESELVSLPIIVKTENPGFNFKASVSIGLTVEGFYWLLVYLDDKFFTQTPLEVVFRGEKVEAS